MKLPEFKLLNIEILKVKNHHYFFNDDHLDELNKINELFNYSIYIDEDARFDYFELGEYESEDTFNYEINHLVKIGRYLNELNQLNVYKSQNLIKGKTEVSELNNLEFQQLDDYRLLYILIQSSTRNLTKIISYLRNRQLDHIKANTFIFDVIDDLKLSANEIGLLQAYVRNSNDFVKGNMTEAQIQNHFSKMFDGKNSKNIQKQFNKYRNNEYERLSSSSRIEKIIHFLKINYPDYKQSLYLANKELAKSKILE